MLSLSHENQANITKAFNLMSRYLDDTLNIYNEYFEQRVYTIYPNELQLNKTNIFDMYMVYVVANEALR